MNGSGAYLYINHNRPFATSNFLSQVLIFFQNNGRLDLGRLPGKSLYYGKKAERSETQGDRKGHIPNPDLFSSLLYFRTREPLPYYSKSDELAAYLHAYQDNTGSTELEDCVQEGGIKQDPERPCTFDLNAGGPSNIVNGYGFDTAQACFVLKMGRIYGWLPDPIDEFATGALVKCSGVTADDTYNLGVIRYFDMDYKFSAIAPALSPSKLTNGSFHSMFFPYRSQLAYLQPLVFVMFDGVKRNTFIRVRCWLIAKNIKVDFEKGEGSTQFEIIYD